MAGNADDDDAAPLIMSPPSPIVPTTSIDIEAGPSEQIQCRICLETDGRDFITPFKCKGMSKYVHQECLDQWRAVKEGFANHCTTCKAPYYLRVHALADRKWRTLKFRFFVTRDILFIFLAVQLVIASLSYIVYMIDGYQDFWLQLYWGFDKHFSFYYICGALLFFALLGLSGCFITCYDRRVQNDLAQPCRELCLCCCHPGLRTMPKDGTGRPAQGPTRSGTKVERHGMLLCVLGRGRAKPLHPISSWVDSFRDDGFPNVSPSTVVEVNERLDTMSEDTSSHGGQAPSNRYDQEASKPTDKIQRRLAQNREAARKSRMRKKVYIQQLELSRTKLMTMEQELERVRQQGTFVSSGIDPLPFSATVNSGIVAFEMEYGHWVEEQNKQICELRNALNTHITDVELRILVDTGMKHYFDLFQLKAGAAKADVFYLMSGMWKTSTERFFLWIGGFRPSDLLKVLQPQLEPLTNQQVMDVYNLRQSCEQAEEALSQGMDKLQQTLAETVGTDRLGEGIYTQEMANNAIEKLEALVSFVNQADHLRRETLQQMHRILTIRQAARGLLALGEYFQRLRALSSLWCSRPSQPS